MWWNSVDLDSVEPPGVRPRRTSRTPQWHSTVRSTVPIDAGGPAVHPLTLVVKEQLQYAARLTGPSMEPSITGNPGSPSQHRPKSAPAASSHMLACSYPRAHRKPVFVKIGMAESKRPQSAPTMLRGTGMRRAHEDGFLQMIESSEVKRNVTVFKHERLVSKVKVGGIDFLADTYLYDLKVQHNQVQRAKSTRLVIASPTATDTNKHRERACRETQTSNSKNLEMTAIDRVRDLRKDLSADLRRNCQRARRDHDGPTPLDFFADIPEILESKDSKNSGVLSGIGTLAHSAFFKSSHSAMPNEIADEPVRNSEGSHDLEALPSSNLLPPTPMAVKSFDSRCMPSSPGGKPIHQREQVQRAATKRLGELAGFLVGSCGSIGNAFNALDANNARVLSLPAWEDGVRRLGFGDDVSYVFRLLGKDADAVASLDEIETLFAPFLKSKR